MKVRVNVTQNDIKNGKRIACRSCPVALALQRILNRYGYGEALVFRDYIEVRSSIVRDHIAYAITPMSVEKFVTDFDARREVQPFKFVVEFKPATEATTEEHIQQMFKKAK